MKECDCGFRMPFWNTSFHAQWMLVRNRLKGLKLEQISLNPRNSPKGTTVLWPKIHENGLPGGALKYDGIDPTSTVCSTWWWVALEKFCDGLHQVDGAGVGCGGCSGEGVLLFFFAKMLFLHCIATVLHFWLYKIPMKLGCGLTTAWHFSVWFRWNLGQTETKQRR